MPAPGNTIKVTIASSSVAVSGTLISVGSSVECYNSGSALVFARFDGNAATSTDYPLPAGVTKLITRGDVNTVSVIGQTSTSCDVFFTPGEGT